MGGSNRLTYKKQVVARKCHVMYKNMMYNAIQIVTQMRRENEKVKENDGFLMHKNPHCAINFIVSFLHLVCILDYTYPFNVI